jgi:hypothetical protein
MPELRMAMVSDSSSVARQRHRRDNAPRRIDP